jgi:uncharacterized phage-associated protein
LAVANEFLLDAEVKKIALTAMQLQKLCYLAHGFTLAIIDRALTLNRIEAWDYGPVYPDLYDALKNFGAEPVTSLISRNNWATLERVRGSTVREEFEDQEKRIIDRVWADYGVFAAFQLSALTHEADSPWAKVYTPGKLNIVIPDSLIKDYFLELTKLKP